MRDVPNLLCASRRLDEECVRRFRPSLARPFQIDHRVDQHVADVYILRSKLARDRFRENSLCGFGRREAQPRQFPDPRRSRLRQAWYYSLRPHCAVATSAPHYSGLIETRDSLGAVTQLVKNGGAIRSEKRCKLTNARGSAIEQGRRAR